VLGPAVLDRLRLVEHQPAPGRRGQLLDVPGGGGVGGDDQVGAGGPVGQRGTVQPAGAVVGVHP
jgi:hypothetical protein